MKRNTLNRTPRTPKLEPYMARDREEAEMITRHDGFKTHYLGEEDDEFEERLRNIQNGFRRAVQRGGY
jgi:hypothetical protein